MTRARVPGAPAAATRSARAPFVDLPDGWRVVEERGPAWFVTHALLERPDGSRLE